jgi:CHRD domain
MKNSIGVFLLIIAVGFMFTFAAFSTSYAQDSTMKSMKMSGKGMTFYAKLSGKNVVPPVKTEASGSAKFTFSEKGDMMHYVLNLKNIDSVSMAHIHHAAKGENGSIAVWLFKGKVVSVKNGVLSKGDITGKDINLDSLKTWMQNGDAYVLVHTVKHPDGEIRGQIHESSGMTSKTMMKKKK